jgi:CheY-like chemotaxis protein
MPSGERKPRALVADDTPSALMFVSIFLKRIGYDVVAVEDGKLALDAARAEPGQFDMVLTDLEMPEMDGFELLDALKSNDTTRDLPVIVISGLNDTKSVSRCIERGAEDHLAKPFDEAILKARVTAVLERKRLRDREVSYLARVGRVIDAARAAESGQYDSATLTDVGQQADELGRLARVFDSLVSSVKAREQRLNARLESLQKEVQAARSSAPRVSAELPDDATLASGELFAGRYEVTAELGRGAMGMVYRARDLELGEEVAIKTVPPSLLQKDPTLIDRFKTELRLARSIAHANVVRSYDFGQYEGISYLTMEFVAGVTLRDLIARQGKLGVASTLAVGAQLADALAVAHAKGVIHRDIKPHNLLLDAAGVLKVMDFGIARPVQAVKRLTASGIVVGTPSYMAPEQLFGGAVDTRADLYSTGVVLYQCLTGALPHDSENVFSLAVKLVEEEPVPPRARNPEVPAALSALVMHLLAKEPAERTASATALAEQLRQAH